MRVLSMIALLAFAGLFWASIAAARHVRRARRRRRSGLELESQTAPSAAKVPPPPPVQHESSNKLDETTDSGPQNAASPDAGTPVADHGASLPAETPTDLHADKTSMLPLPSAQTSIRSEDHGRPGDLSDPTPPPPKSLHQRTTRTLLDGHV